MSNATAPVVRLRGVSKRFDIYDKPTDLLIEGITGRARRREFMAVKGVSFDVLPGSMLGILGRNGAGKSTLLKMIAGTLLPTSGELCVRGKVSAVLELGSGFHPDRSGRDNVLIGGLCLGLSRAEITRKFDQIVEFAELWQFIDRPFRTYSSGMQARLTFAVATSVDPDVLIIDEALSVGDARFQLKSLDRVRDFKRRGTSILFVSHSINQIVSLCDQAILLERGELIASGLPNVVGNFYHELLFGSTTREQTVQSSGPPPHPDPAAMADVGQLPGSNGNGPGASNARVIRGGSISLLSIDSAAGIGEDDRVDANELASPTAELSSPCSVRERRYGHRQIEITNVYVLDADGAKVTRLRSLARYTIVIDVAANKEVSGMHVGFLVRDTRGMDICGWDTASGDCGPLPTFVAGEARSLCIQFMTNLNGGTYFLTAAIAHSDHTKEDVRFDVLEIAVEPVPSLHTHSLVNLEVKWVGARASNRQEL